jgi:DNA-binding transcriptional LysR family regulator
MDRLDELHVLTTILEAGSLAGAARRLRRSPPAITRSLAALEARTGARLLQRTTRRLVPTAAGRRIASAARRLLADYEQATRSGAAENVDAPVDGTLRLTAPSLFGRWHIAPLLARFLDENPAVRAELVLTNRNLDLIHEGIDVALRIGALTTVGLITRRVGEARWVLVASSDYLARRGHPRTPKDLQKHDIVYHSLSPSPIEWRFDSPARKKVVRLSPRYIVNEIDAVLDWARAGRGIGRVLSYQVADDLASGAVVPLLREYEPPASPVQLVVPNTRYMPRAVRSFLDLAVPALSRLRAIHLRD